MNTDFTELLKNPAFLDALDVFRKNKCHDPRGATAKYLKERFPQSADEGINESVDRVQEYETLQSSPVDGALRMAARGLGQILLQPHSKEPLEQSKGWQVDTTNTILTTNPEIILVHKGNFGSGALAKIGGYCFFEIDTNDVLDRIKAATGHDLAAEAKFLVRSRSGRGHIYFRHTEKSIAAGNISQSYILLQDWSFRGKGQYVLTVGSIHPISGKPYELLKDGEIPPIPDWLVDWMLSQKTTGQKNAKDATPRNEQGLVPHGAIHGYMVSVAGRLRDDGLEYEELEPILQRMVEQNCEAPINRDKVTAAAASICKYKVGTAFKALVMTQSAAALVQEPSEPMDEFHFIALEPPKNGNTLCIFTNEEDAKVASSLGFNATAIAAGDGLVPLTAAITSIKMTFERVVIFGENNLTTTLKPLITPGSITGDFPQDFFGDYGSLSEAVTAIGEAAVVQYLDKELKRPELLKTSLLLNQDVYKMRTQGVLQASLNALGETKDPRVVVRASVDSLKQLLEKSSGFPPPLTSVSLHGLVGEFVELAYPTTAACRELLAGSIIPIIGAMFGRSTPCMFGSDVHPGSTFYLNIARTADGKGQALNHAIAAARAVDSLWMDNHYHTNVASGEALVRLVCNRSIKMAGDNGNRLVIVVPEMTACFTAQNREGSTLSDMIRNGWDGVKLENQRSELSKSIAVTGYTLGVCGAITPKALRDALPEIDWKNGSVNRFLWNVMSGSKDVSRSIGSPDFQAWGRRMRRLIELSLNESTIVDYSAEAAKVWDAWVDCLPVYEDEDPMADGTARSKPHALRLANLYAQVDERRLDGWKIALEPQHVEAAIEHVERGRASMQWYLDQDMVTAIQKGYDKQDIFKLRKMVAKAIEGTGMAAVTAGDVYKAFSHMTVDDRNQMCLEAGMVPKKDEAERIGKKTTLWVMVNPKSP